MKPFHAMPCAAGTGRGPRAMLLAVAVCLASTAVPAQDIARESVAAAIHEAGYACAEVIAMQRSPEGAAEGFTVWRVHCDSGTYRVTFKGDTGADVVRAD